MIKVAVINAIKMLKVQWKERVQKPNMANLNILNILENQIVQKLIANLSVNF